MMKDVHREDTLDSALALKSKVSAIHFGLVFCELNTVMFSRLRVFSILVRAAWFVVSICTLAHYLGHPEITFEQDPLMGVYFLAIVASAVLIDWCGITDVKYYHEYYRDASDIFKDIEKTAAELPSSLLNCLNKANDIYPSVFKFHKYLLDAAYNKTCRELDFPEAQRPVSVLYRCGVYLMTSFK